jgi:hypothetical protein
LCSGKESGVSRIYEAGKVIMPLMEFAEDINGYGVRFDPETGKITYSIGGRIFKTLLVMCTLSSGDFEKIQIKDGYKTISEFPFTGLSLVDHTKIMKVACDYAGTL